MGFENKIKNSYLLANVFGHWPSFHDAEVLRIILDRDSANSEFGPNLQAAIHVFEMTSQVDEGGRYVLRNHMVVNLRFFEVVELSLVDFNYQNVLMGLSIEDISDRQLERVKFGVSFDSSFGVGAEFQCHSISVESVEPFVPEGA